MPQKSLSANERLNQKDDNEDLSFSKTDIDVHTPFSKSGNSTQAKADKSFVTVVIKKSATKGKDRPALAA